MSARVEPDRTRPLVGLPGSADSCTDATAGRAHSQPASRRRRRMPADLAGLRRSLLRQATPPTRSPRLVQAGGRPLLVCEPIRRPASPPHQRDSRPGSNACVDRRRPHRPAMGTGICRVPNDVRGCRSLPARSPVTFRRFGFTQFCSRPNSTAGQSNSSSFPAAVAHHRTIQAGSGNQFHQDQRRHRRYHRS